MPKGVAVSTQIYSLVETAKANGQEPYRWLRHVLVRLPQAQSVLDYEPCCHGTGRQGCDGKRLPDVVVEVFRGSLTKIERTALQINIWL